MTNYIVARVLLIYLNTVGRSCCFYGANRAHESRRSSFAVAWQSNSHAVHNRRTASDSPLRGSVCVCVCVCVCVFGIIESIISISHCYSYPPHLVIVSYFSCLATHFISVEQMLLLLSELLVGCSPIIAVDKTKHNYSRDATRDRFTPLCVE